VAGLVLAGIFLGGCWDRLEVEHRAFVMAIAVDRAEEKPGGAATDPPRLRLAFQIANPSKLAGGGQEASGKGGGTEPAFWNLATVASGVFLGAREVCTRLDRVPYFEHLQLVLVGEELAREGLEPVLDFFRRNSEMHGRVEVAIAAGEAGKVLEVAPRLQPLPALYLADVLRTGQRRTGHQVAAQDLIHVFSRLASGASMVLPRIEAAEKEVKVAAGAVLRQGRLVGWLGETEAEGFRWLQGEPRGIIVGARLPGTGAVDAFEVWHARTRIVPQVTGGRLSVRVVIQAEGGISEHAGTGSVAQAAHLAVAEEEVGRTIARRVQAALRELKRLRADAAGFGQEIERHHPLMWERLKQRWEEEIFPTVPVQVEAQVRIRQVGLYR